MENLTSNETKTKWVLDPSHSELLFKVRHLMITNVNGSFTKFNAEIEGEDILSSTVRVSIDSQSISTNDANRDGHLKSPDFFDVENHPEIKFVSTAFTQVDGDDYELTGLLTIRETSKEIKLKVEFGGISKDPWGNEKAGFSISGKINRKDWNLNWNVALEAGGMLVSDEVKIQGEVQFAKQNAA